MLAAYFDRNEVVDALLRRGASVLLINKVCAVSMKKELMMWFLDCEDSADDSC